MRFTCGNCKKTKNIKYLGFTMNNMKIAICKKCREKAHNLL